MISFKTFNLSYNNYFFFFKDFFSFNTFDPFFSDNFFFYTKTTKVSNLVWKNLFDGDYYNTFEINRDNILLMSKTQLPIEMKDVVRVELRGISRFLGNKNLDIDSKLFSQITNTDYKVENYSTFFDTKKSFNFDIYIYIRDYLLNNISLYDLELDQSWLKDSYLYDITHHISNFNEDIPSTVYNNVLDYDLSTNTPVILRYFDDSFFFESDTSAESLIRLATRIHRVDLDNTVFYSKLRWIFSPFFSKDSNNYLDLTLSYFHKHKYNSEYIQALYSALFKDLHWGDIAIKNRDINLIFNDLFVEYNGSVVDRSYFTLHLGMDRDVDQDVFLSFFLPEYKFFSYKEGEFFKDEIMDASGNLMDTEAKKENFSFSNLFWPEQVDRNFRDVKTRYETLSFDQRGLRDFSLYFHSDLIECLSFMPIWVLYYLMFSGDVMPDINTYLKVHARPLKYLHHHSIDPDSILGYQWMGSWLTLVPKWYWDRFDPKFIITIAGDNVFINNYWLYDLWLKNTGQDGIFSKTSFFSIFNISFGSHFLYNFGIFWYYILLLFSIPIFILWFIVLFLSELDRNTFNFYQNWPQNSKFLSQLNKNLFNFQLLTINDVFLFLFEGKGLSKAFPLVKFLVNFYDFILINRINKFINRFANNYSINFKFKSINHLFINLNFINKLIINNLLTKLNYLNIYFLDIFSKLIKFDISFNFYIWKEHLNYTFNYNGTPSKSLFFSNFYDYYYSIVKFSKYYIALSGYHNARLLFWRMAIEQNPFSWVHVKKQGMSTFYSWFFDWIWFNEEFNMYRTFGFFWSNKNIEYNNLINYFKFNIKSGIFFSLNNLNLNSISSYISFYFYTLNINQFNIFYIFSDFFSNLKNYYISSNVLNSVLNINKILDKIKSFSSFTFNDINKRNKALFFDVLFKSNTKSLANKNTYGLAQLLKIRLDFIGLQSDFVYNMYKYRDTTTGEFSLQNKFSFDWYLNLISNRIKKLALNENAELESQYFDRYRDFLFNLNSGYPVEGFPLCLQPYNSFGLSKILRSLLTYKNNIKYFIYGDNLSSYLKKNKLTFSQAVRMRHLFMHIARGLLRAFYIKLTLNKPFELKYISENIHKKKLGRFFTKSKITKRTALWNDVILNFKSMAMGRRFGFHNNLKRTKIALLLRNFFFMRTSYFRLPNFMYLERLSSAIESQNLVKNKIATYLSRFNLRSLFLRYPNLFSIIKHYRKLTYAIINAKALRDHLSFIKNKNNFYLKKNKLKYDLSAKKLYRRYLYSFNSMVNNSYISDLKSSFINKQNIFNQKIFNSLNYSSSLLHLLQKKIFTFFNITLTLDKLKLESLGVSNIFEHINLYFNMLNHIFNIIEKSFIYPLISKTLSMDTRLNSHFIRKLLLTLARTPGKGHVQGTPLLSFNHLFGEYSWFLANKNMTEWFEANRERLRDPSFEFRFGDFQQTGSLGSQFLYSEKYTSNGFFSFIKFIDYLILLQNKLLINNNLSAIYSKSTSYFLFKISNNITNWVNFIDNRVSTILNNFNTNFYSQKFYNSSILTNINNFNLIFENNNNTNNKFFYKIDFKFCFDIFAFYVKDLQLMDVFKNLHSFNYSNLINLVSNYLYFPKINSLTFNFSNIILRWNSVFFIDKFIDINYFNNFIFTSNYKIKSDSQLISFFNENKLNIIDMLNIFKLNDFLKKFVLSPSFTFFRYLAYTGFFSDFFLNYYKNNLRFNLIRDDFFFHPDGAFSTLKNKYIEESFIPKKDILDLNTFNLNLALNYPIELKEKGLVLALYDVKNKNYFVISENNVLSTLDLNDLESKEIDIIKKESYLTKEVDEISLSVINKIDEEFFQSSLDFLQDDWRLLKFFSKQKKYWDELTIDVLDSLDIDDFHYWALKQQVLKVVRALVKCAVSVDQLLKELEQAQDVADIQLKTTKDLALILLKAYQTMFNDTELDIIRDILSGLTFKQLIIFINSIRIKSSDSQIYFMYVFLKKLAEGDPEVLNILEENPQIVRFEDSLIKDIEVREHLFNLHTADFSYKYIIYKDLSNDPVLKSSWFNIKPKLWDNWLIMYRNIIAWTETLDPLFKNNSCIDFKFFSYKDSKYLNNIDNMFDDLDRFRKNSWFDFNLTYIMKNHVELKSRIEALFKELYLFLIGDILIFVKNYAKVHNDFYLKFWLDKNFNHCFDDVKVDLFFRSKGTGPQMYSFLFSLYFSCYEIISYILFDFRSNNLIKEELVLFNHWRLFLCRFSIFCDSFFAKSNLDGSTSRLLFPFFNIILSTVNLYKMREFDGFLDKLKDIPILLTKINIDPIFKFLFVNFKFKYPDFYSQFCDNNERMKNIFLVVACNMMSLHNINLQDTRADNKIFIFDLVFKVSFFFVNKYALLYNSIDLDQLSNKQKQK